MPMNDNKHTENRSGLENSQFLFSFAKEIWFKYSEQDQLLYFKQRTLTWPIIADLLQISTSICLLNIIFILLGTGNPSILFILHYLAQAIQPSYSYNLAQAIHPSYLYYLAQAIQPNKIKLSEMINEDHCTLHMP